VAPAAMPQILLRHANVGSDGRLAGQARRAAPEGSGLAVVHRMLQDEYGIDFTHYKPTTVTRRIERRLALARSHDIEEYVERLRLDQHELDVLYRDLLIGVTRFFRDEKAFELLEKQVLPDLLRKTPRDTAVRIWVAGCATGEEAYSLAIVLLDLMAQLGERQVKIFATDVHRGSLECASRAIYDEPTLSNVSQSRLERYFLKVGDAYQVAPDIRQMVVFAQHNVIKDAPFTRIDLITCRNLLIYLQPTAQQKVLSFFHFALHRDGVLFLGPSESTTPLARGFEVIDKQWQLHRKHSDVRTPVETRLKPVPRTDPRTATNAVPPAAGRYSLAQLLGTYDAVLDEMMPPSLLVSDRGELVHAFAGASRFLKLRDGRQGLDVLELVDSELKMVLIGGLRRALAEPTAIVFKAYASKARAMRAPTRSWSDASARRRAIRISWSPSSRARRPNAQAPVRRRKSISIKSRASV
jgi:two-component system CheB/CheR fusion protein